MSLDLSFSPEKQGKALAWDKHVQEAAAVVPPADVVGWSVLPRCECMGRTGITPQAHHGMSFPGIGRVSQANRDTAPELAGLRGQGHQPTRLSLRTLPERRHSWALANWEYCCPRDGTRRLGKARDLSGTSLLPAHLCIIARVSATPTRPLRRNRETRTRTGSPVPGSSALHFVSK